MRLDFGSKGSVPCLYLLTYLLTPRCRVLLEQLTGLDLVKKFPTFHGTRRFITALTSVRHLCLSWASPILFIYPHPTSWRSILILSTHLRLVLPSCLSSSGFPTKTQTPPLLNRTLHSSAFRETKFGCKFKGTEAYFLFLFCQLVSSVLHIFFTSFSNDKFYLIMLFLVKCNRSVPRAKIF